MADQEIITVSELDVADGASLSAEDQLLVHKATEGKMQRVAFSGLFSQESAARTTNDAALQLQINTMAGIDTDGETPTYRVVEKMDQSLKGVAGGVAELDSEGHVPSSQLPSYVDDVIEGYYKKADGKFYENYTPASVTHDIWSDGTSFLNSDLTAGTHPAGDAGVEVSLGTVRKYGTDYYQLDIDWYQVTALTTSAITLDSTAEDDPAVIAALKASDDLTISYIPYVEDTGTYSDEITPETGKIYVDLRTNLTYRWGSTVYAPLSSDLALGETSATAYRGDRGKVAYDHSQVRGTGTVTADNPHGLSKADIGLGNVPDVTTNNQTPTYEVASDNAELTSGETLSAAFGKIAKIVRSFISHIADLSNPHSVTKAQVGLGDVTNVATTSTITSGDTRNITSGAVYTALSDLDSAKQNKTLDTPLIIDGTSRTTVESALGSLNTSKLRQVTTMPASPSSGDTVLYLGSETGYLKGTIYQYDGTNWKIISGAGGGGTVAHFSTMSDWETARLITEGNEGFLADDSLVVIDATNFIYIQNGTGSSATLTQIDASVIEYVRTLPVSGIEDKLYALRAESGIDEEIVKSAETLTLKSSTTTLGEPRIAFINLDSYTQYCSIPSKAYSVADKVTGADRQLGQFGTFADATAFADTFTTNYCEAWFNALFTADGDPRAKDEATYIEININGTWYPFDHIYSYNISYNQANYNRYIDIYYYDDTIGHKTGITFIRSNSTYQLRVKHATKRFVTKLYYGDKENQTLTKVGGNDIFVGTQAQWDLLSTAEKNEYQQANLTDVNSVVHVPVDTITDGNMNPVTSNAVYDAIAKINKWDTTQTSVKIAMKVGSTTGTARNAALLHLTDKLAIAIVENIAGPVPNAADVSVEFVLTGATRLAVLNMSAAQSGNIFSSIGYINANGLWLHNLDTINDTRMCIALLVQLP